ncbi:hypothetical protein GCM10010331_45510 [Streptomyces xanthochromogenes]|uniref:hypothetical protein n=1 Tax=Streptomyces xanthochromogenes TaxID=67384 RepID=UPI001677E4EB|nr:hypothetical protein [Streptomyces xanthochromogenes]GHB52763.1 hypothetical protein GCM10010331_45510 [Streptomyces xanthochromogenes]
MADSQKQPMSMFDRRRSGRGDNVKYTVDSDELASQRLANIWNDRSTIGAGKRITTPVPRIKKAA